MSLVSALEEYLNDPNFEQNRIEYKTNKALADKGARDGSKPQGKSNGKEKGTSFLTFLVFELHTNRFLQRALLHVRRLQSKDRVPP